MKFLILVLLVCTVSITFAQSKSKKIDHNKIQDLGLNPSEKFHVMTAGLATAVVPGGMGIGYYMYDRPDVGKKYLITQSVLGITSLGLALSCPEKKSKVLIDPDCEGDKETALNVSFGLFLAIWIWQIFDVIANGKSYLSEAPVTFHMQISEQQNLLLGFNYSF